MPGITTANYSLITAALLKSPPSHLLLQLHPGEAAKLEEVDGFLSTRQHWVVVRRQLVLGRQLLPLKGLSRHGGRTLSMFTGNLYSREKNINLNFHL